MASINKMKTINKMIKAFGRDDLLDFTGQYKQKGRFFDIVVGKYKGMSIRLTNDPEKLLGCGFRLQSSYSPTSASFKYLPSFVLQDYIGMLYITDGTRYKLDMNGIDFVAPNYLARAFVMIAPGSQDILFKMPTYSDKEYYDAFNDIEDKGWGYVYANTKAPEIHLDVLDLYQVKHNTGYPNEHIAICGRQYPCKESASRFQYAKYYGGLQ